MLVDASLPLGEAGALRDLERSFVLLESSPHQRFRAPMPAGGVIQNGQSQEPDSLGEGWSHEERRSLQDFPRLAPA